MRPSGQKNKQLIGGMIIIAMILLVTGALIVTRSPGSTIAATSMMNMAHMSNASPMAIAKKAYKDGIYTEVGTYNDPGGQDSIRLQVTLAHNVITDAVVTPLATDGTCRSYQDLFVSGFKGKVIGKDISAVRLSYVAGSSLTSAGFNDALAKIAGDASA